MRSPALAAASAPASVEGARTSITVAPAAGVGAFEQAPGLGSPPRSAPASTPLLPAAPLPPRASAPAWPDSPAPPAIPALPARPALPAAAPEPAAPVLDEPPKPAPPPGPPAGTEQAPPQPSPSRAAIAVAAAFLFMPYSSSCLVHRTSRPLS